MYWNCGLKRMCMISTVSSATWEIARRGQNNSGMKFPAFLATACVVLKTARVVYIGNDRLVITKVSVLHWHEDCDTSTRSKTEKKIMSAATDYPLPGDNTGNTSLPNVLWKSRQSKLRSTPKRLFTIRYHCAYVQNLLHASKRPLVTEWKPPVFLLCNI